MFFVLHEFIQYQNALRPEAKNEFQAVIKLEAGSVSQSFHKAPRFDNGVAFPDQLWALLPVPLLLSESNRKCLTTPPYSSRIRVLNDVMIILF